MIFYPKSYFKNILEIDMNFIKKNNIKAILLDIDNTMIDTDNNILEGLEDWVEEAKKHGIKFCILSNTNKKKKAEKSLLRAQRIHAQILSTFVRNEEMKINLFVVHAEDQMMSSETILSVVKGMLKILDKKEGRDNG